jgi:hypothetical protein
VFLPQCQTPSFAYPCRSIESDNVTILRNILMRWKILILFSSSNSLLHSVRNLAHFDFAHSLFFQSLPWSQGAFGLHCRTCLASFQLPFSGDLSSFFCLHLFQFVPIVFSAGLNQR